MKRLLLIVLPLLLIVGCSKPIEDSSKPIEDSNGQKIYEVIETYDNGDIKSITYFKKIRNSIVRVKEEGYHWVWNYKEYEGTYKNDRQDGLWTSWYKNGQKKNEQTYRDGKMISSKEWNEDGSPK